MMTTEIPNALRMADELENYGEFQSYFDEVADELRRLHELNDDLYKQGVAFIARISALEALNAELLEALKQFANCELNEENCASLEVATRRIRSVARAAIAKGEQA